MQNENTPPEGISSDPTTDKFASRDAACSPRLFRVRVTYDTVILAETEKGALRLVKYGTAEIDDMPVESMATPITSEDDLPPGWSSNCLPWGIESLRKHHDIKYFLENA